MVDFRKRAEKGAADILAPDEVVLAGVNVFPGPFRVAGGFTGGLVAGGAIGAAVGAAWDSRNARREEEDEAVRPVPSVASRSPLDPPIPANGGLLGVTSVRVLVWSIGGMGKAKDLLHDLSLHDIDEVVWQEVGAGWMRGRPASLILWMGVGDHVLAMSAIDMAASGKHARLVVESLTERRPGRVSQFTP